MTDQPNGEEKTQTVTHSAESGTPPVLPYERSKEFWRRNKIIFLHLPIMLGFLFGSYILLKSWDSRIGVEGFGDIFGYALNGVRITLIIFTAWWIKRWCWFDFYGKTELDLFDAAREGNWMAFGLRAWDRVEWVIALCFATYWYTR